MQQARILDVKVGLVRASLRRPFVTALGRRSETVNAGITLRLSGGAIGYGEASTSLAMRHLGAARLAGRLRELGRRFLHRELGDPGRLVGEAWKEAGDAPPAAAAFECALLGALARGRGLRLADWFGGRLAAAETDLTISAVPPAEAAAAAAEGADEGFAALKVKLAGRVDEDIARLKAVRAAAPRARLLFDGNQGFGVSSALRLLDGCARAGIRAELFEQPLPKEDVRGLAALSRRSPVPIAADESCATPEQAARLAEARAVSVFNVKLAKSGLARSLQIAAVARAAGIELMIGCMAETAAGLSPSVHFALGTGFFRWLDLDSDRLLASGPRARGWRRMGARVSLG